MEGFLEEVKDCEFFFKYNEIFRKGLSWGVICFKRLFWIVVWRMNWMVGKVYKIEWKMVLLWIERVRGCLGECWWDYYYEVIYIGCFF